MHTDDVIGSLSLNFFLWNWLGIAVDRNAVPRYNSELDAPCCLRWLIIKLLRAPTYSRHMKGFM